MSDSPPSYSYQRSAAPISSSKMEEFYPTSSSSERTARALAAAQQSSQREDYRERERERERGYGPARTLADLELRRGFDDTGGLGGLSGGIGGLEGDTIWEDIQANIGEQLLGGGGGGGGGGAGVGTGAGQGSGDIEDIDMENVNIPEGYILVPGNKAPQSGKAPKNAPAPLKRGNACLYCRRRKLRCNAQKPRCSHCIKGNHLCEYDAGKPRSRVKALEAKIAELEGKLNTTQSPEGTPAAGGSTQQLNLDVSDYDHSFSGGGNAGFTSSFPYGDPYQQGNLTVSDLAAAAALAPPMPMPDVQEGGRSRRSEAKQRDNSNGGGGGGQQEEEMPIDPRLGTLADFGSALAGNPLSGEGGEDRANSQNNLNHLMSDMYSTNGTSFLRSTSQEDTPYGRGKGLQQQQQQHPMIPDNLPRDTSYIEGLVPSLPYAEFASAVPSTGGGAQDHASSGKPTTIGDKQWAERMLQEFDFQLFDPSFGNSTNRSESISTGTPAETPSAHPSERKKRLMRDDPAEENRKFTGTADHPADTSFDAKIFAELFGDNLTANWFETTDLPAPARDKLLSLYFQREILLALEMDKPRFYARLEKPKPQRPHPCLLYAMYLLAVRYSDDQSLKNLEPHFYRIANEQFTEGLKTADRLLDLVRGAALITVYLYSHARYHEAMISTGRCARLAVSCGLHRIDSCTVKRLTKWNRRNNESLSPYIRSRNTYVLPPPKDDVELGERINAFWQIYYLDRAGTIATGWVPALPTDEITTTFPHPLEAYHNGTLRSGDDASIPALFDEAYYARTDKVPDTRLELHNKAMILLHMTSSLLLLKPEPGVNLPQTPAQSSVDSADNSSQPLFRWWMTPRIRTPRAFANTEKAVKMFIANLPPDFKDPLRPKPDGSGYDVDIGALSINTYAAVCCMFLEDVDDYRCDNRLALTAARRCLAMIHALPEAKFRDLEIYMTMLWSYLGRVLIKEAKRLRMLGESFAAASVEVEIDVVIKAQKKLGAEYGLASTQASLMEQWKRLPVPDVINDEEDE